MKELQEIREDILLLRNLGCITKEVELVLLRKLNSVEQQLRTGVVNKCACTADETTGTTTVRCCNICGKPAESFWRCG